MLRVDRGGSNRDQVAEIGHAAHGFQLAGAAQFPGQSDLVDGLIALEEGLAGGKAELIPLAVEIVCLYVRRDAGEAVPIY